MAPSVYIDGVDAHSSNPGTCNWRRAYVYKSVATCLALACSATSSELSELTPLKLSIIELKSV